MCGGFDRENAHKKSKKSSKCRSAGEDLVPKSPHEGQEAETKAATRGALLNNGYDAASGACTTSTAPYGLARGGVVACAMRNQCHLYPLSQHKSFIPR